LVGPQPIASPYSKSVPQYIASSRVLRRPQPPTKLLLHKPDRPSVIRIRGSILLPAELEEFLKPLLSTTLRRTCVHSFSTTPRYRLVLETRARVQERSEDPNSTMAAKSATRVPHRE
jgi:hypothetical protein